MKKYLGHIDWILFLATLPILGAGLVTMYSFTAPDGHFEKQIIWACVAIIVFFVLSMLDLSFLKKREVITFIYILTCTILGALFVVGTVSKGAQSWFRVGFFSIQPSDISKVVLILVLAKYFSKRHIEIANIRHIIVSGLYTFILFILILIEPDFGSAIILFIIWLGMVMVSGISKKHLFSVFAIGIILFGAMWGLVFAKYQKERIINFIHPLANVRGSGYNAYQSTITVGSGEFLGKGIGYGTQSRLNFLPEYQTDFIFAAFTEEWGFVGAFLIFLLFGVVIYRVLKNAMLGATNFEILYGAGVAILFMSHLFINIGMNMGLLPVTGITVPFMSYGGSHLVAEYGALGILIGMRRNSKVIHEDLISSDIGLL